MSEAKKNVSFTRLVDWMEGRLPADEARTVEDAIARGDRLTLADVAEILNTSSAQVYALVRRKELRAMKLGGRGKWRVLPADLEAFIQQQFEDTDKFVDDHPFDSAAATEDVTD